MKLVVRFLLIMLLGLVPLSAFAQDADTFVGRLIGNPDTFNPLITASSMSQWNYGLVFPTLFEIDPFSGQPQPGLASWSVSDDGLTYTFTIRDDAVWSDGTPITAADAKFSFDAIKSENVQSVLNASVASVVAVNAVDDKTLEVVLDKAYCTAIFDIYAVRVLPAHKYAADYSDFMTSAFNAQPDISGGPYIMTEYMPDEFVRYVANETYWGGAPKITNWIYRVIPDPVVANQSLLAGESDFASMRGEFSQFPMNDDFIATPVAPYTFAFFTINFVDPTNPQPAYDADGNMVEQTPHPIFGDVRVRQAFAMGYSKQDIIDSLGDGAGVPTIGAFSPSVPWAYNPDLEPYPYDPEQAAALLDEAGWVLNPATGIREKDGMPLAFELAYSPVFAYFETMALIAQDQLSQLGMDIKLTSMEIGALLNDKFFAQRFDVVVMSNGDSIPDPDGVLKAFTISTADDPDNGGQNVMSYVNPEYDALVEQAGVMPGCSIEDRAPLYHEIQRIQHEDVMIDSVMTPTLFNVVNRRIENMNPGPWWLVFNSANQYTIAQP